MDGSRHEGFLRFVLTSRHAHELNRFLPLNEKWGAALVAPASERLALSGKLERLR